MEWDNWYSGDCLYAPDVPGAALEPDEVVARVLAAFPQASVDRAAADRWAEHRVARAIATGYRGFLLDAERALVGRVALVSVPTESARVQFFLTPDASALELNYDPPDALTCRSLATQLAAVLGYEIEFWSE